MTPQAPTLTTARLTLRMPVLADFEHRAAFYASGRSHFEGGPKSRAEAWRIWASEVAQWLLMGYGPFSLDAHDGRYVGEVGLYHPVHYPDCELGWFVIPEAEGQGLAGEAARAVLDWARDALRLGHLVSYIDPGNLRSLALAHRLGGVRSGRPGLDPTDVVILHDLRAARGAA